MSIELSSAIGQRLASAWPGTTLAADPSPLSGGFWASMYRLQLEGQPPGVPTDVVFRIAPDPAMGAKELAVQRTLADLGFPTPHVRLTGPVDDDLAGSWSVMDFAQGNPPLRDLNGVSALRRAPALLTRIPVQLATALATLHALDPAPVSSAVEDAAPGVAWSVEDLLDGLAAGADELGRPDLVDAVGVLAGTRPVEGATVVCHGDLHPFNILDDPGGRITVIDWTGAIRAAPAYDLAFTMMLLADPPLDAPGPLERVIRAVGARVARAFIARYLTLAQHRDLSTLEWYRALHGLRILTEAAAQSARHGPGAGGHPYESLIPVATAAVNQVTGSRVTIQR